MNVVTEPRKADDAAIRPGVIHGVGLGPGDPELMSVRAARLVGSARHVAFFRKRGAAGRARGIVEGMLAPGAVEHAMEYPVTTEIPFSDPRYRDLLAAFYEDWTDRLSALSAAGEEVVVLCEGDPFFYGSFMHLYERLRDKAPVQVTPAITGMSAAWTATGLPVTWGDDVLSVVMATLPEEELTQRLAAADAVAVMKIGRNLPRLRSALEAAGKFDRAWMVEFASMERQRVRRLADVPAEETAPYFSIVIVHGQGRRP